MFICFISLYLLVKTEVIFDNVWVRKLFGRETNIILTKKKDKTLG